jgi:hypothetical protein
MVVEVETNADPARIVAAVVAVLQRPRPKEPERPPPPPAP